MADVETSFSTEQPQQETSATTVSQPPPVSAVSVSEEQPLLTTTARPSQAMPAVAYPCQTPPSADQASRPVAAYSPPHHYQGQQPSSTAFGGSPGGASFGRNTQVLVMASLSVLSGAIGLVTCIIEGVGLRQLNYDNYDDYGPVGPGISAGVSGIGIAIFGAAVFAQVMRYRTYGQNAVAVKRAIVCQVVALTNWMGIAAATLPIAATFSALFYEAFPGVVNCALLLMMALLNLAGAVIGCFTTCSIQCGGCCTCEGCCANPSEGSYQRLVNDDNDGPMQTRVYGTFALDIHRQTVPPSSNSNTWQRYPQQTPFALTGRNSNGVWPRPGTIQVAQPIHSHALMPHTLNGESSDGVSPQPGTIPVAQPIHSHAQTPHALTSESTDGVWPRPNTIPVAQPIHSNAQMPHALTSESSDGVWPRPGNILLAQPIHSHAQPSSQTSTLASVETTSDNPNGGPADALGEDGQPQRHEQEGETAPPDSQQSS